MRKGKTNSRDGEAAVTSLFEPLTEGERVESLRLLLEDIRLANMAKVRRYRVIAVEPIVFKANHPFCGRRVSRIVVYDYAGDRCVEANVDLDGSAIGDLLISESQPMLSHEEEMAAMEIALSDERVQDRLALGELPQSALHYGGGNQAELSHSRRSAAVLLGETGIRPSYVVIVDLLDSAVREIVPAQLW